MSNKNDDDKNANVKQLLQGAKEDGDLSKTALDALTINADIGAQIQAGLGIAPDDVPASQVVLVTIMPDDSGSIHFAGNTDLVREGHNIVYDSLKTSKQKGGILAHTRYLNGFVLFPYRLLDDTDEMTSANYEPMLGTPLYDQTAVLLGTVLAKTREFEESGVPVRTVTLIITDGGDCDSHVQTPKSIKAIIDDMLKRENHIIAAMGIEDGSTDFRKVFKGMGIPDQWILTTKNTEKEIRKAFQMFSQSAVRASQSSALFSQALAGGFIN